MIQLHGDACCDLCEAVIGKATLRLRKPPPLCDYEWEWEHDQEKHPYDGKIVCAVCRPKHEADVRASKRKHREWQDDQERRELAEHARRRAERGAE